MNDIRDVFGLLDDPLHTAFTSNPDGTRTLHKNVTWICVACGEEISQTDRVCPDCGVPVISTELTYEGAPTPAEFAALAMLFRVLVIEASREARDAILHDLNTIARSVAMHPETALSLLLGMKSMDEATVTVTDVELMPTLVLTGPDPCNAQAALTMSVALPDELYDHIGELT